MVRKDDDDRPFGGGAGMVLKPEPLFRAIESFVVTITVVTEPRRRKFNNFPFASLLKRST